MFDVKLSLLVSVNFVLDLNNSKFTAVQSGCGNSDRKYNDTIKSSKHVSSRQERLSDRDLWTDRASRADIGASVCPTSLLFLRKGLPVVRKKSCFHGSTGDSTNCGERH